MKRHRLRTAVRNVPWAVLLMVLGGCGGGDGGPAAPQPGVPALSNLVATFGSPCTFVSGGGSGTTLILTVNYLDSDGDEQGGTLRTRATFQPSGSQFDLDFGLPSARASVTGTTQGTITVTACIRFGGSTTGATIEVVLIDKAGHVSNIVSIELQPQGIPEKRRGTEDRWGDL